jgi:hypothetical protein
MPVIVALRLSAKYKDEGISGSRDSRPALDRLMRDARARTFDVVIVTRFDRFAHGAGGRRRIGTESDQRTGPHGHQPSPEARQSVGSSPCRGGSAPGCWPSCPWSLLESDRTARLNVGRGTAERAFRSLSQKPCSSPDIAEQIQKEL